MIINSYKGTYEVFLKDDFSFWSQIDNSKESYFIIDRQVYDLYKDILFCNIPEEKLSLIEAIEENKTIETALSLCEILTNMPSKRNTHLISIGGGIIQDITGFVCNILYRGIQWTFIPTTLLAACDSCIGGKTSLNYKQYKNLLGTFFPPDDIYICPLFFKTLTEKDYLSGLGEVVKFNIMTGAVGLETIEIAMQQLLEREDNIVSKFVQSSLIFKKKFIEDDEFDKSVRIHLNFAHTFGHAFETVSHYKIPHGTAVAMGMIVADRISLGRNLLSQDIVERSEKVLCQIIKVDLNYLKFDLEDIISAVRKDKKQTDQSLTAVLLHGDLELGIFRDVLPMEIEAAIVSMLQSLEEKVK